MKTFLKLPLQILFASIIFSSCQKESIDPVEADQKIALEKEIACKKQDNKKEVFFLTGNDCKAWTVFRYFINGDDLTAFVPPCNLDNTLTFCVDGSYTDREDETRCDSSLPDIYNQGTFQVTQDGSGFSVTSPNLTGDFTIVELKPNILKAYFYDANRGGVKTEFWLYPADKKKGAPL